MKQRNEIIEKQSKTPTLYKRILIQLLEQISERGDRLSWFKIENDQLTAKMLEKNQLVQTLSAQIAKIEHDVRLLSSQLIERESATRELLAKMIENEQSIQSFMEQVTEKEQIIQSLSAQMEENKQSILIFTAQVIEKEQINQALSIQVSEKEQINQALSIQVSEKEQINQALSIQVSEKEQINQALSIQVSEKEQIVQSFFAKFSEKEQLIQALTAQVAEKEKSVQVLTSQITPIVSSRAWRIILFLWRVRLFFIPHESLREKIVYKYIRQLNLLAYSFQDLSRKIRFAIKNRESGLIKKKQGIESSSINTMRESSLDSAISVMNMLKSNSDVTSQSYVKRSKSPLLTHDLQVDIIVCIHNALEDVEHCLDSIIQNTTPPYRLILIDDGSNVPTKEFLENFALSHNALLLRNEFARGYTFAANQGLRISTGQYTVLLNSDTIVFAEWIDRLISCAESDAQIGLVGPLSNTASWQSVPEVADNGDWAKNLLPSFISPDEFAKIITQISNRMYPRLPFLNGFCLLIRRQLLEEIGVFDEEIFGEGYGEENDYAIRARKAGWELAVADDVWIYHHQSRSYSHERRLHLATRADEYLSKKHDASIYILPAVEQSRNDRVLLGIRTRIKAAIECKHLLLNGTERWKGLRIGIVIPVADEGGGGHVIIQESQALQSMGINVELLNLEKNRHGFHIAYPDCECPINFYSSPEELVRQTVNSTFPYDFILCTFNTTPGWFKHFLESHNKPQMVYYVQDFEPKFYLPGSIDYQIAWNSYTLISNMCLVTKTRWNYEQLKKQIGVESIVLGPSVDIKLFYPRPKKLHSVVHLCAMIRPSSPRRAPERTLEILSILYKRLYGRVEIYTFGCTDEELSVLSAYTGFPLEGIHHCGRLTRFQMADLLNSCDIFADYSEFQAMGLTTLEAMSSGCAVLVPIHGGSSEFVTHNENGLVVDTSDLNICIYETERLILNDTFRNRLSLKAIEDACHYFPEKAAYRLVETILANFKKSEEQHSLNSEYVMMFINNKTPKQFSNFIFRGLLIWHNYGFHIFLRKLFYLFRKKITISAGQLAITFSKLNKSENKLTTNKSDIFCFSVIDWDFRYQRPQHLLKYFANAGHRVFYVNTRFRGGQRNREIFSSLIEENIWELFLPGDANISIYRDILLEMTLNDLQTVLTDFIQEQNIIEAICLVHHPFWTPLVLTLREKYGWKIVYDCMDNHGKFPYVSEQIPSLEKDLVLKSDLVIVTSSMLYNNLIPKNPNCILIQNAGDYAHFSQLIPHEKSRLVNVLHPVIGFFGAIAEWVDVELLYQTAVKHPNWSFALIGDITGMQVRNMEKLSNVHFLGEKPYGDLPNFLVAFDVCIIPFRRTELTEAMNPVKVFEYLSAGKPVVARNLPELASLSDVVYLYDTPDEFVNRLEQAISEDSNEHQERRRELAQKNTWEIRYQTMKSKIESLYEKASIIIVTWDNLEFTQKCIQSVLADQTWPNYEIIVVDNASKDGTEEYLKLLSEQTPHVKVFFNKENLGFATANNIGLKSIQDSKFVVLLNNDTVVSRGWLSRLLRHARQPDVGMVGPVTNSAGNEARIDVPYMDLSGMESFASGYTKKHYDMVFDINMLAMYCVAMRKEVFDQIGTLDERFGVGMFEDDDYSHRVRQAGYRLICAEDVFIHHYGRISLSKLAHNEYYNLFERNRRLYEEKWGEVWIPHKYRRG